MLRSIRDPVISQAITQLVSGAACSGLVAALAMAPLMAQTNSTNGPSVQELSKPLEPIPPITTMKPPWPSPSLNPGVPSAFVAQWGDVFVGVSGGTPGTRPDVDGSLGLGFGLGSSTRSVALEVNAGCGSFKRFCGSGGLGFRLGRVLVQNPTGWLAVSGLWQNAVQWSFEGRQDNIVAATVSYARPLRPISSGFAQTLQFNAGVGNSTLAPYTATNSESKVGGFASIGVELTPALGVSTGWSGRGVNAQLSYTPFEATPLTFNLLGADLFNQNPSGTVAVLSVVWGNNFRTPNFR